jgi:hypothetical protein
MAKSWCGVWLFPVLLAGLLVLGGCNQTPDKPAQGAGLAVPGGPTGPAGGPRPLKDIMVKLNKPPQSLLPQLGQELKADSPVWETIQPQTQEVVRLVTAMSQADPPRGNKDSWKTQTAAYLDSATALEKAAQAKDRDAAVAAQDKMAKSCMGCHREHR